VDIELIEVARALIDARTDDANHTTGAAARTASGRIITGVNVFHFTGGPWAELVVIGSAAAEGAGDLVEIVAVGDGGRGSSRPADAADRCSATTSRRSGSSSRPARSPAPCTSPSYCPGATAGTQNLGRFPSLPRNPNRSAGLLKDKCPHTGRTR
jgi:hypothetical protein